jgi:hypothetical protein
MVNKKFIPKIIFIDIEALKIAESLVEKKLTALDDLRLEFINLTNLSKVDFNLLISDAEKYVIDTIYNTNKKHFSIPINPSKLVELLDIDLTHLKALKSIYDAIDVKVNATENVPSVKVNPDDFTIYTETEIENARLEIASKFKNAVIELRKDVHVYIQNVSAGISNILTPNYRTSDLDLNVNWIKDRIR